MKSRWIAPLFLLLPFCVLGQTDHLPKFQDKAEAWAAIKAMGEVALEAHAYYDITPTLYTGRNVNPELGLSFAKKNSKARGQHTYERNGYFDHSYSRSGSPGQFTLQHQIMVDPRSSGRQPSTGDMFINSGIPSYGQFGTISPQSYGVTGSSTNEGQGRKKN